VEREELKEYLEIVLDMEKNILLRKKLIETLSARRNQLGISKALSMPSNPQDKPGNCVQLSEQLQYYQDRSSYYMDIAAEKVRLMLEKREKSLLCREIDELTVNQSESESRLRQIYGRKVIFPKYQNLVAVSSLYEYICAGRCYALEGPEGAYNLYETESRFDKIITRLDKISTQLDEIRDNQFVLFSSIQEINQQYEWLLDAVQTMNERGLQLLETVNDISDGLSRQEQRINSGINEQTVQLSFQLMELQKTSALAVYHAERTQRELAYMNRMDFWSGRNDGVFFNIPPV